MKNRILAIALLALLGITNACAPIMGKEDMGGIMNPSDIKLEVVGVTPGSNSVILRNLTPGVTGQWVIAGEIVGVGDEVGVILASPGENKATFIAVCDGGTVKVETTFRIEKLDVIPDAWLLFAGATNDGRDGKAWVWDTEVEGGNVVGYGGYGHSTAFWGGTAPGGKTPADLPVYADSRVVFDTNGGANVTVTENGVTKKGSWSFNEKKALKGFSIGKITLSGVTLPCGTKSYYGDAISAQVFDVIKTDDDHIVLNWAPEGAKFKDPNWATLGYMWVFKADK